MSTFTASLEVTWISCRCVLFVIGSGNALTYVVLATYFDLLLIIGGPSRLTCVFDTVTNTTCARFLQ